MRSFGALWILLLWLCVCQSGTAGAKNNPAEEELTFSGRAAGTGTGTGTDCPECRSLVEKDLCRNVTKASEPLERAACELLNLVCEGVVCPPERVADHLPLVDSDGDRFSTLFGWRGAAWRGKDCDDADASVYPGRLSPAGSEWQRDVNCNGIYGRNATSGSTYEDELCAGSDPRGLVLLSDSTGTHFGPPIYPLPGASVWEENVECEFDWPFCSWATGHRTDKCQAQLAHAVPLDSFYLKLWRRNRCNHRNFQNLAVDGANSGSNAPPKGIVTTLAPGAAQNVPSLVMFAMVANDVCTPHPGTSHMTTPAQFKANNLRTLEYLEAHVAPGSHVVFIGLFHGEIFWEHHASPYPYFGLNYAEVWDILSSHQEGCPGDCRTLNPCWAWMNSNATWRETATKWAHSLNAATKELIAEHQDSFKNFDMVYIEHPDLQVKNDWVAKGYDAIDLFEPIAGGHPSQTASVLWANSIWETIEQKWPHFLGPVNPRNAEIEKIFGTQGGY